MTTINMALYRWLLKTGASDQEAEAAARMDASDLVTKADLAQALGELKAELFKHITQTMVWLTAIYAGLMTVLLAVFRFVP